jgi:hypothetical protein
LEKSRAGGDCFFQGPVEEQAAILGLVAVEAEGELIQVEGKMLWLHPSLVRAEYPSLERGSVSMNVWKVYVGWIDRLGGALRFVCFQLLGHG